MKAVQIKKYGGSEVLELINVARPNLLAGQVLIENYASCVNPVDVKIMQGFLAQVTDKRLPMVLGSDVAGSVLQVGEGVTQFSVGDKVYGSGNVLAGATGAFAQLTAAPEKGLAKMPATLDFNQAGAMVLTGTSALQALDEHLALKAGQKILIHGGAGGIGSIAIQLAKHMGAYVATTATGNGLEYVQSLGADQIIDWRKQKFNEIISEYDAVFDTIGGQTYRDSFLVLKKNGILVSMVEQANKELMEQHGVTAISQFTNVTGERLKKLAGFIEQGVVHIHIEKSFPLDNIRDAFEAKINEDIKGKIGIEIKSI